MVITFNDLRTVKDNLPSGSMQKIADELDLNVETVRNYFGATHYEEGSAAGIHVEQGANGGIVRIEDTTIYDVAVRMLNEQSQNN